jgi:putative spermidine/putrescine transport system ATP-binding protein
MGPPDRQRSHATQPPSSAAIVELRRVGKRYMDVVAVDDISFTIAPGEFVTLLGPSGSGKTTLLNLIVGTTTPSSGSVFIGGRDASRGRGPGYPGPPAQIPACGFPAPGSC